MRRFSKALYRGFSRSARAHLSISPKTGSAAQLLEETRERYAPGGYHPVRIGDAFDKDRYKVLRKLGFGIYSTVWLARDEETKQQVALKILAADAYDGKNDLFELAIHRHMSEKTDNLESHHVLGLLDDFWHEGPNGKHLCLVSKALGPDLGEFRQTFPRSRLPIPMAKKVARHLLLSLAFLHDTCGVIHTNIKPDSILVDTPALREMFQYAPPEVLVQPEPALSHDYYMESEPVMSAHEDPTFQDMSFCLADFGLASWVNKHLTEWIQPEKLRAPEVILRAAWDAKVDIWSLGLVIWELVTGQLVFDGQATATSDYFSEAHLAQMQGILGPMPASLLARSSWRDIYFDQEGNLESAISFPSVKLASVCADTGAFSDKDDMLAFVELISSTLALEPQQRPSAQALLKAEWLQGVQ